MEGGLVEELWLGQEGFSVEGTPEQSPRASRIYHLQATVRAEA